MASILVLEAANMFVGNHNPNQNNAIRLQNVQLPIHEENLVDHAAGGAPVAVEVATHVNRYEITFSMAGWQKELIPMLGDERRNRQQHTIYGALRDIRNGELEQVKAVVEGRLARVAPSEFRRGDLHSHAYSIRAIYRYTLHQGNRVLIDWDFFASRRVVDGRDLNRELNRILRIPT